MEELFNKFICLKIDAQSIASFFQNDFEGPYPEHMVEEFTECMDNFIHNLELLKSNGIEFIKNKK